MVAQLTVRKLEGGLVRALKIRAAINGRSAEAEHRAILRGALAAPDGPELKTHLLAMPDAGDDADFERSGGDSRPVEL